MKLINALGGLVKGKVLITTLIGAALVGGTGIALAATPTGHDIVQHMTGTQATATPTHEAGDTEKDTDGRMTTPKAESTEGADEDQNGAANSCPGQPEAQDLATKFSLSTDSKGGSMQVICALHDGTFQGTVNGKSVTIDHALGYGEISDLLTFAQSLAKKNNDTLTDGNVLNFVAMALNNCGSTAVEPCVNANVQDNNGHDMNNGNSTATPTSHPDEKPTSTPTPHK